MAYPETMSELTNYPKALSHAGTGGGTDLKPLTIKNMYSETIGIYGVIVDGIYYSKLGMSSTVNPYLIQANEEVTVYYAEPEETSIWVGGVSENYASLIHMTTPSEGVFINNAEFVITNSAENPVIEVTDKGTPTPGN